MNFKHMDFQKKTMLALVVLLIVILVYAVAFAAPVRRKSEECQEELVQTERQIREQKDLSENKRWIEQEMDGLPFRMEELPEYNNQKHEMKELKEIFGLDENVKKSNLSVGYTWNANIIVGAQKGERAYNIWLKSLYTGADLNKIDEVQISEKTESNTVANVVSAITNFTSEWVEEFCEHPGGKIMETIMDPLGHVLGDGAQWLANLVQALPDDTYRDTLVLYTYKDLATDNKDGVDNTGIYGDGTTTKSSTLRTAPSTFSV